VPSCGPSAAQTARRAIRIWSPATGATSRILTGHRDAVATAIGALDIHGETHIACAGSDHAIRVWNLSDAGDGEPRTLAGHQDRINAMCTLSLGGTTCLATASADHTARIWDPTHEASTLVIPIRDGGMAVAHAAGLLFIGTIAGLLAVRLDAGPPGPTPR
jgi:WD40 repeat protein